MAKLLNGRTIAKAIRKTVKDRIEAEDIRPGLVAILVGNDEASHIYVRLKERAAKKAGVYFERIVLPATITQAELEELIETQNVRNEIHAILLQLPLPGTLDEDAAILKIDPKKDVDGFHPENIKRYLAGEETIMPVLTRAVMELILASNVVLEGKHAAVIANNPDVFAPPILKALETYNVTTDWFTRESEDVTDRLEDADIVIAALGAPHYVQPDMLKPGAIAIDIGTTKVNGELQGDVDPASDAVLSYRTPVPGGVGPVTVAALMSNVLTCYDLQT